MLTHLLEGEEREGRRGREEWGRIVTLPSQTRGLRTETTFQVAKQGQLKTVTGKYMENLAKGYFST